MKSKRTTKRFLVFLVLILLMSLAAACSGQSAATPAANTSAPDDAAAQPQGTPGAPQGGQGGPAGNPMGDMPVTAKLVMGTLMLETTDLKVDAVEAQSLLPLWKAVRTMSSNQTSTGAEIESIFEQIQETMTPEQIAAIETMNMDQEALAKVLEPLGIEMPTGRGGGDMPDVSDSERATRIAEFRAQGGGQGGQGGGPGGGGGQPPVGGFQGGGGFPGGGMTQPGAEGQTQGTPDPSQMRRQQSMGMNAQFLDAVITLLEQRAKG